MSFVKQTLAAAVLATVATSASAALVQVQSQTQSHAFSLTTWTDTLTFNLYDPSLEGGKALQRVELSLYGESLANLTFNATTQAFVSGQAGSSIFANVGLGGGSMNIDVSPQDSFGQAAPGVAVPAGGSTAINGLTGNDTDSSVSTDAGVLASFTGPGTFNVDLLGLGSLNLTALGGNVDTIQNTQSMANFTVTYFVDDTPSSSVPVPSSLALLGLGLLAMSARKKARNA